MHRPKIQFTLRRKKLTVKVLQKLQVFFESWEMVSYLGENLCKNSRVSSGFTFVALSDSSRFFVESDLELTRFVLVSPRLSLPAFPRRARSQQKLSTNFVKAETFSLFRNYLDVQSLDFENFLKSQ